MEFREQQPAPENTNVEKLSRREALQILVGLAAACATPGSHTAKAETPVSPSPPAKRLSGGAVEQRETHEIIRVIVPRRDTVPEAYEALTAIAIRKGLRGVKPYPGSEIAALTRSIRMGLERFLWPKDDNYVMQRQYEIDVSLTRWQETRNQAATEVTYSPGERGLTLIEAFRLLENHPEIIEEWKKNGSRNIPFILVGGERLGHYKLPEVAAIYIEGDRLYVDPAGEDKKVDEYVLASPATGLEFGTPIVIEHSK